MLLRVDHGGLGVILARTSFLAVDVKLETVIAGDNEGRFLGFLREIDKSSEINRIGIGLARGPFLTPNPFRLGRFIAEIRFKRLARERGEVRFCGGGAAPDPGQFGDGINELLRGKPANERPLKNEILGLVLGNRYGWQLISTRI